MGAKHEKFVEMMMNDAVSLEDSIFERSNIVEEKMKNSKS